MRLIGLWLVTILVYAGTWSNGFTYEDTATLAHIDQSQATSVSGLIPSRWLSAVSIWAVAKVDRGPQLQHVVNLGLHLLNGGLIYILGYILLGNSSRATLVAAIFLLHPLPSEAVLSITARPDLLATFFVLGGTILIVDSRWIGAAGGLLLAMMSKEIAVVGLPLAGLAFVMTRPPSGPNERRWSRGWLIAVPLAIVAVGMSQIPAILRNPYVWSGTSLWQPFLAFWRLVGLAIMPVGLSVEHDYSRVSTVLGGLAAALTGVVAVLIVPMVRKAPVVAFGLAWALIAVLPRFFLILPEPLKEYQFYLAFVGLAFVLSEAVRYFLRSRRAHL